MFVAKEEYVETLYDIANILETRFYELTTTQEAAAIREALLLLLKDVGVSPTKKRREGTGTPVNSDGIRREAWKILMENL